MAGGEPEVELASLETLGTERELAVIRALRAMPGELRRAEKTLDPSKVVDATFED
jgi:hypothetical protein